jgi:hypothetical protein
MSQLSIVSRPYRSPRPLSFLQQSFCKSAISVTSRNTGVMWAVYMPGGASSSYEHAPAVPVAKVSGSLPSEGRTTDDEQDRITNRRLWVELDRIRNRRLWVELDRIRNRRVERLMMSRTGLETGACDMSWTGLETGGCGMSWTGLETSGCGPIGALTLSFRGRTN